MKLKNQFLLCLILGLALSLLAGCGSGGGSSSQNKTGNLMVQVDWPDREIPTDTQYFTVDLYRVSTTTKAVPTTTIVQPQTTATISSIPTGRYNLAVYAFNADNQKVAYASRIVYVAAGDNHPVDLTLNPGQGLWTALMISRQRNWQESGSTPDQVYINGMISNPVTLEPGPYTFTIPDGTPQSMIDLGPGGETTAINYFIGNPASDEGLAQLEGRGSGSCYAYSQIAAPETETGNYRFNVNGTIQNVNYPHPAPAQVNITNPGSGDILDLNTPILINWESLGSEYGYLVKAYSYSYSVFSGEDTYKYCWSNVDLRNLNFNNLQALSQMVDNLPNATSATIPAGVFPPGSAGIVITVTAFNKTWKQTEMEMTPNLLVLPYSSDSIMINIRAWSTFKQDASRNSCAWVEGPDYSYQRWTYSTGGGITGSPVTDYQGTIYIGSQDGKLYAVNGDGSYRWSYDTGSSITQSALFGDFPENRVFVGAEDGKLYALDQDGNFLWSYTTGGAITNSPILGSDGSVIFGSADHKLYSLSAYNGNPAWVYTTGDEVHSSPAADNQGNLYFGSDDGSVYALNPNGQRLWSYNTGAPVKSTPCITPNRQIIIGSDNHQLYAFNSNGSIAWSYLADGAVSSSPAMDNQDYLYFGSEYGTFYSLFPNGVFNWSYHAGGSIVSAPMTSIQRNVYFGVGNGRFLALDDKGELLWEKTLGSQLSSSPAMVQEGIVYIGSGDGQLYCLGAMQAPPVITAISPNAQAPGGQVTITGNNFGGELDNPSLVFYHNQPASIISRSSNFIIATVPQGALTGPVYLELNGLHSDPINFTVTAP